MNSVPPDIFEIMQASLDRMAHEIAVDHGKAIAKASVDAWLMGTAIVKFTIGHDGKLVSENLNLREYTIAKRQPSS